VSLSPAKQENPALKSARSALSLMAERGIEPTPINYAVWFHYVAGNRPEMNREIDDILKKRKLHFSDDVCIYLYNKYIIGQPNDPEKAAESVSVSTQNVLAEIMQVIEKFSGDTQAHNKEIDAHVTQLSQKITDPALKEMAKEIITRSIAIRDSGAALGAKLEESRREVAELKQNLEKITTESNRDFLTGVSNRKALEARLDELAAWARDKGGDVCLLMIDIDHFKKFNDKFGHLIGDEVLKKVGRGILDSVKGKDFVARYGGEEFAVLLPNTPLSGGLAVGEGIRRSISETELLRKDTGASIGTITVSIGVARYRPETDSVPLFISRADDALYRSKMGGRNRVTQESFERE
jgi:diguanylate cyclase